MRSKRYRTLSLLAFAALTAWSVPVYAEESASGDPAAEIAYAPAEDAVLTYSADDPDPLVDPEPVEAGWKTEEGKTYYIDEEGNPVTGWQEIEDAWYYFDPDTGEMQTGWFRKGKWSYLLDPETGKMQTGWQQVGDQWYYLNPTTGIMKTGWLQKGKWWYYFDPETGAMQTDWVKLKSGWYFFHPETGVMKTGWLKYEDQWYYLRPDTGTMKRGWLQQGTNWYYLKTGNGAMLTGWLKYKDAWYYFKPSTGAMHTGWVEYRDQWYFFEKETGTMKTGLLQQRGHTYLLRGSGEMAVGWETLDGRKYYFKETGEMAVQEILTIDGKREGFSGEGDWLGEKSGAFLDTYGKAIDFVQKHTDSSMTKEQKLRKCFETIRDTFYEKNPWIPHYTGTDWAEKYAGAGFDTESGNCFTFGACMAFSARAIGYDDVYACSSGGHGWAEIGGAVYDPEWTKHASGNYFGRPLKSGDSPNYLGAVTRTGSSWTYRKI